MTLAIRADTTRSQHLSWMMGLLLVFFGCGHDEEQDHHLEHLIPAHKPQSFAEAVEELSSRGATVFTGQGSEDAHHELLDIIDWLPELAADSDLKRTQWEQVRDTGFELREIATNLSEESQLQWNALVQQLGILIPDSDTWKQRSETGHDSASLSDDKPDTALQQSEEVPHD